MNITFRDFISLSEGKQVGILYHFTRLSNLANMLDDGFDMKSNHKYVSFTRDYNLIDYHKKSNQISKNFEFQDSWGNDTVVRLAIDGDRLSNRYKIQPFMDTTNDVTPQSTEQEEIIKGNADIEKYITQIDVVYGSLDVDKLEQELAKTKLYNNFKVNYVKSVRDLKKIK